MYRIPFLQVTIQIMNKEEIAMKKKIWILLALLFLVLVLLACECEHEWIEATCTTPKVCAKCEEASSAPMGHTWEAATCYMPKTCTACSLTEGTALEHTPGTWSTENDFINCEKYSEQRCTVCNLLLQSVGRHVDSLVDNGIFIFTPTDFLERFTSIAKNKFPDFHYEIATDSESLWATIYYGNKTADIGFYTVDSTLMTSDSINSTGAWCVSLVELAESDDELRSLFYLACDPTLDEAACSDINMGWLVSYANAATYGELFGYLRQNNLLYEFSFYPFENSGQQQLLFSTLIYASDWLEESGSPSDNDTSEFKGTADSSANTQAKLLTQIRSYDKNSLMHSFSFHYNQNNQLISVDTAFGDTPPETYVTFSYDYKGRLLTKEYRNPESGPYRNLKNQYNQSGQLVSHIEYGYPADKIYTYKYDSDGNLVSGTRTYDYGSELYQEDFTYQHITNTQGNIIESYRIFEADEDSDYIEIQKYIYDTSGCLSFSADENANSFDASKLTSLRELTPFTGSTFTYDYRILTIENSDNVYLSLNFTDTIGNTVYSIGDKFSLWIEPSFVFDVDEYGYIKSITDPNGSSLIEFIYSSD